MTRPYRHDPVLLARRRSRDERMAALFRSGMTLEEVGNEYGCSREYIRQCISKIGLTGADGGMVKRTVKRRLDFKSKKDALAQRRHGCTWDQYLSLRRGKITRIFIQQRNNANRRGIGWDLTLWQWWSIWQQSGHWAERGRGRGYHMCRLNDVGPYAVDNVYIATGVENMKDYWVNRYASLEAAQ